MIEFSEKNTQILLCALTLLKNEINKENNQTNVNIADVECLITKIKEDNIDRHIRNIWKSMLARCRNSNNIAYKTYGGKGITVCEEWKHLKNFKAWCLENNYKIGLTVDRINGDGNYSSDNCRLATQKQQQRNRKNNRIFTDPFDGEILCMSEIAEKYNIKYQSLVNRLNRKKMSLKEALTVPFREISLTTDCNNNHVSILERIILWHDNEIEINEEYTIKRISEETNIKARSILAAISLSHNSTIANLFSSEFQCKKYKKGNTYKKQKTWSKELNKCPS